MTKLLLFAAMLVNFVPTNAICATQALIAKELRGSYKLIKQSGKGAQFHCDNKISVSVEDAGVFLISANFGGENFHSANNSCENAKANAIPAKNVCTTFSKKKVFSTSIETVGIGSFIKDTVLLTLNSGESEVLTYKHAVTVIPFGTLGIWDNQEFNCKYKRIKSE